MNKFQQRISETLNLGRRESAVLCTLLLRGAQTLGEIRDRSERMFAFADLAETETVLDKLADWPGGASGRNSLASPARKKRALPICCAGRPRSSRVPAPRPSRPSAAWLNSKKNCASYAPNLTISNAVSKRSKGSFASRWLLAADYRAAAPTPTP